MDPTRFDRLARARGGPASRRSALGLLLGGALGGPRGGANAARTKRTPGRGHDHPKFPVCHDGKTLVLPLAAAQAHLVHGDRAGRCDVPPRGTCAPLGNVCSVPFGNPCCAPSACTQVIPNTKFSLVTICMGKSCASTDQCAALFPNQDVACDPPDALGIGCPALADKCCRAKACTKNQDCPKSGVCCSFLDIGTRCCAPGQTCWPSGCL
jgi:hypothetical protein